MTETVRTYHHAAMMNADEAVLARHNGDMAAARNISEQAYKLERAAAELLPPEKLHEPSRSILWRSAAALANSAGLYVEAFQCVEEAQKGYVPAWVMSELADEANRAWRLKNGESEE